jgi:hypothetical protein
MGVVIEICVKYPGGPTRITVTDLPSVPGAQYRQINGVWGSIVLYYTLVN